MRPRYLRMKQCTRFTLSAIYVDLTAGYFSRTMLPNFLNYFEWAFYSIGTRTNESLIPTFVRSYFKLRVQCFFKSKLRTRTSHVPRPLRNITQPIERSTNDQITLPRSIHVIIIVIISIIITTIIVLARSARTKDNANTVKRLGKCTYTGCPVIRGAI